MTNETQTESDRQGGFILYQSPTGRINAVSLRTSRETYDQYLQAIKGSNGEVLAERYGITFEQDAELDQMAQDVRGKQFSEAGKPLLELRFEIEKGDIK